MKQPVLSAREKAAFGPRSLKPPGSPEWCWQTLDRLVGDYKLIDERFDQVGETLAELSKVEAWKVIPAGTPYGTPGRMFASELGIDYRRLKKEIADARERKLGKRGRPKKGEEKPSNRRIKAGTNRAYILARLDRDGHAELAAKVRAGDVSASAAAQEAKYPCKPPLTPIERILKELEKPLTRAELLQARTRIDELLQTEPNQERAA